MKLVTTKTGKIEGIEAEGYTIFKGIPYAKPPVGELRWKAPQPIEPWDGVYHADRFRERGWQEADTEGEVPFWKEKLVKEFYDLPEYIPEMSEDSLYLNIWTPAEKTDEKLPVAFGFTVVALEAVGVGKKNLTEKHIVKKALFW